MSKYVCGICGYIYDDEKEAVKFVDLPADWSCPICGAPKSVFEIVEETKSVTKELKKEKEGESEESLMELSNAELSIVFSNLAKGCEKQYKYKEQESFLKLADLFKSLASNNEGTVSNILDEVNSNINKEFPQARVAATEVADRGALRAITWAEKVTMMGKTILERYEKEGPSFLEGNKIFVCEICGFIYIGEKAPSICPVCKVPSEKIHEIK